jgi:hypothetical protein
MADPRCDTHQVKLGRDDKIRAILTSCATLLGGTLSTPAAGLADEDVRKARSKQPEPAGIAVIRLASGVGRRVRR